MYPNQPKYKGKDVCQESTPSSRDTLKESVLFCGCEIIFQPHLCWGDVIISKSGFSQANYCLFFSFYLYKNVVKNNTITFQRIYPKYWRVIENDSSFMLKMWFGEALFIWHNILIKMFLDSCTVVQTDGWEAHLLVAPVWTHVFPLLLLFNRPAQWMGRRIHFWRRTLLHQVGLTPSLLARPPWHQNLLTQPNLKHQLFLYHQTFYILWLQ